MRQLLISFSWIDCVPFSLSAIHEVLYNVSTMHCPKWWELENIKNATDGRMKLKNLWYVPCLWWIITYPILSYRFVICRWFAGMMNYMLPLLLLCMLGNLERVAVKPKRNTGRLRQLPYQNGQYLERMCSGLYLTSK